MEPDNLGVSCGSKNPVDVDIGDVNPATQEMYGVLTGQVIECLG